MSENSTAPASEIESSAHSCTLYERDLAALYKAERVRREVLQAENDRLQRALDNALDKPSESAGQQMSELDRLRAELEQAHRQNLVYAADLARSFSGERAQSRALTKTQEQLSRSQKLATLGQMVAAVAHDVN